MGGLTRNALGATASTIDFDREIRPILSENCFTCHGPDEAKRKAKLRLDVREEAFKPAKSGERALVAGDLAHSELWKRITTQDDDERMPPSATGKKLTPQQIAVLQRWIEGGATWKTHWAFLPPARPEVPVITNTAYPKNEIDHFIVARLEKEGLQPSPEADKTTLVRRAALDLTGLPPSVSDVEGFLADGSDDAYEKLVDRLMATQRFGEQQTRYWLDAVRYADTHGYHIDSRRDMWKYRDWLIQAFNDNKPFDEFTTEQLAGDLLPNSTLEQKIATGFVRANMTTGEGGVIEDEYRAKYTFDRVETTGAIYLGMTLICARCHTHKYDPIQQREYYSLYAIFNQLADPVMDGNQPNPEPFVKVPSAQQASRLDWLKTHLRDAQVDLADARPQLDAAQAAWQRSWTTQLSAGWSAMEPQSARSAVTNGAQLRVLSDRSVVVEGANPEAELHELIYRLEPGLLAGLRLEVLPLTEGGSEAIGRAPDGSFTLSELEGELTRPGQSRADPKPEKLRLARAVADGEVKDRGISQSIDGRSDTGWQVPTNSLTRAHFAVFVLRDPIPVEAGCELKLRLRYEGAKAPAALAHFRFATVASPTLAQALHPPQLTPWQVLGPLRALGDTEAALVSSGEPEQAIDLKKKFAGVREEVGWSERTDLEDGKDNLLVQDLHGVHGVRYLYRTVTFPEARTLPIEVRADGLFRLWVNGQLVGERRHEEAPGEGPLQITAFLRAGENQLLLKLVTVQGASYLSFTPELGRPESLTQEIASILSSGGPVTEVNSAKVRTYFRRQHSPEFRTLDDAVTHWRQEQDALDRVIPTTMVAKESDKARETFVLNRGEYDKKGDLAKPGVPAIFPSLPGDAPTNRLGLARWLLQPNHPLTARVTVNRIWQQYFGVGLVKTIEDFGLQGEHPSNPELLDWLATEFIHSGWNVKNLHRLILTSATYRQSSRSTKELQARDPENRLLARGPRFRLDAEALRDAALFTSGLLVEKIGGRSVRPYEPPGLWEAVSFNGSQRYVQDTGDAQYRRSLYTFWKRQSPPPAMLIFDAPTREYCALRRSRSNTPLQALALLNDPQFVEISRAFAQRIMTQGGATPEKRAAFAFRTATARPPTSDELGILCRVYQEQSYNFRSNPKAAELLLAVGPLGCQTGLDPAELAAWTAVANLILNLDEVITKS